MKLTNHPVRSESGADKCNCFPSVGTVCRHSKAQLCGYEITGPLGSVVGRCDLDENHTGPCSVRGVTEQVLIDRLNRLFSSSSDLGGYATEAEKHEAMKRCVDNTNGGCLDR